MRKGRRRVIQAVLFDFDGVLTIEKTGSAAITEYIAKRCGLPAEQVRSCYRRYNQALLLGEMTHAEIWPAFCEALGQRLDYQLLTDSFRATELDADMLHLLRQLRTEYRIALVTDNKSDRIRTILECNNLDDLFDAVAVSAELGSGKTDRRIFDYVLDQLDLRPEECVFIDNAGKNLIVPDRWESGLCFLMRPEIFPGSWHSWKRRLPDDFQTIRKFGCKKKTDSFAAGLFC